MHTDRALCTEVYNGQFLFRRQQITIHSKIKNSSLEVSLYNIAITGTHHFTSVLPENTQMM